MRCWKRMVSLCWEPRCSAVSRTIGRVRKAGGSPSNPLRQDMEARHDEVGLLLGVGAGVGGGTRGFGLLLFGSAHRSKELLTLDVFTFVRHTQSTQTSGY